MPTGYTADVEDGKVTTLKAFASRCAYAFGALVMYRDSGFQDELPEDAGGDSCKYHEEQLQQSESKLGELMALGPDAIKARAAADYRAAVLQHAEGERQRLQTVARHDAMAKKVRRWEPPTPEHEGLKKFMLQQLEVSCEYQREPRDPPVERSAAKWFSDELATIDRSLAYHRAELQKERDRSKERNEWIRALRASLESYEE